MIDAKIAAELDSIQEEEDDQQPFIVRLRSKDCPTRNYALATMLQRLLAMDEAHGPIASDSASDAPQSSTRKPTSMRHVLAKFQSLPKHRRPTMLVLLFEDAECFSAETLQLLIHVCSEYVGRLPFVFMFGIATSPERLYSVLSPSAISKLRIEHFSLVISRNLVRFPSFQRALCTTLTTCNPSSRASSCSRSWT